MDKAIKAARMADQIRDYLALWTHQRLPGLFFSIIDVTISQDLRVATIWIEAVNPQEVSRILTLLEKEATWFQHSLHQALGKKFSPRIKFKDIGFATQIPQNLL